MSKKGGTLLEAAKKKKILLQAVLALAVTVIIIFIAAKLIAARGERVETTLALRATDSEIVGVDAYIMRDEHIVYAASDGVVEYAVADGEKISAGSAAALVHTVSGVAPSDLQEVIDAIDRTIRIFEKSNVSSGASYGDLKALREQINTLFYEVTSLAESGGNARISAMLDELLVMMNQYASATDSSFDLSGQILSLREQKNALLGTYRTASHSAVADMSGYFYRNVDGYELLLSTDKLDTLTYADFSALTRGETNPAVDSRAVGKIVSSYNWYIVINVSQSVADKFIDGDNKMYPVTFTENSGRVIEMELYRKIEHENGALVVLMSDIMPTDFSYLRLQNVNVKLSEHSGYRVPSEAIRQNGSDIGVYTVDANRTVNFKRVKVLYISDAYTIVAENDGTEEMLGYLKLNDVMIVSGKDIYEGKVIG